MVTLALQRGPWCEGKEMEVRSRVVNPVRSSNQTDVTETIG